ncbi:TIGR00282 family metallophosphoesterase [Mycoplasmopsis opalescens]|uniref:TIGR00282 family metallophosphoesterase n=1 Tax=Mycoplasmopsis opalescens TaxID=114886 RepID=UPI0004A6F94D|nr:TIGR00282 family metallophosphoesterase [Mycoplasmopsis opalescens]
MNKKNKQIRILFFGDIFSENGIIAVAKNIDKIKQKYNVDFTIAQAENVTDRKGFSEEDYSRLKKIGIDAFTLGNHVWAKDGIFNIINCNDVIRPYNIPSSYAGHGSSVFKVNNSTLRVTSMMGICFNKLLKPWGDEYALNFFDAADSLINNSANQKADFHFMDFHAETTSEKYTFALYLDGKIDAFCGTHTHVQTNDAHVLPKGTCYITDVGMCGPYDCSIGANFQEVYEHMRYQSRSIFRPSENQSQVNAAYIELNTIDKHLNKIEAIKILPY